MNDVWIAIFGGFGFFGGAVWGYTKGYRDALRYTIDKLEEKGVGKL